MLDVRHLYDKVWCAGSPLATFDGPGSSFGHLKQMKMALRAQGQTDEVRCNPSTSIYTKPPRLNVSLFRSRP
jgi:hypothetical protein